jgi:hypothetical protein
MRGVRRAELKNPISIRDVIKRPFNGILRPLETEPWTLQTNEHDSFMSGQEISDTR